MKWDDLPETCRKCVNLERGELPFVGRLNYTCERFIPIHMIVKNRGQCALFEEDVKDEN